MLHYFLRKKINEKGKKTANPISKKNILANSKITNTKFQLELKDHRCSLTPPHHPQSLSNASLAVSRSNHQPTAPLPGPL